MKLVIVESPTKTKTLSKYMGKGYKLAASMGHIRDLPKKKLGVDIKHNFKPEYVVVPGKDKVIKQLKSQAKKADQIILATDPDREGEAIAHHLKVMLSNSRVPNDKFKRIVFHEITQEAIKTALKHPGSVNRDLFDAQQARRILDRLVGYQISPLLWKKVRRGLSAGRVQSPALRLIVEREEKIAAFKPKEYWEIQVKLNKDKDSTWFDLIKKNNKKLEIKNKKQAQEIEKDLKKADYQVADVNQKNITVRPQPPFITSTLQRTAARVFFWSGKKTMHAAQKLYESGLITYHRTDSFNLAKSAIDQVRGLVKSEYGDKYLPEKPRFYKRQSKLAQEAHEAIRPTNISKMEADKNVPLDAKKLYKLIWKKFVACQMTDGLDKQISLQAEAKKDPTAYLLRTGQRNRVFDGWRRLYRYEDKPKANLPELNKGDQLKFKKLKAEQKFTQPPARYSESMLIKELEKLGIGRPSTYASIVSTIRSRKYVEKIEGRFKPTEVGKVVNQFLEANFAEIVDYDFTAQMEDDLDEIARGQVDWEKMMADFYKPLKKQLKKAEDTKRLKIKAEKLGKKCPKCKKGELVIRIGRFGKFVSCSRFPDCDYTDSYTEYVKGVKCPDCGGKVVIKQTRKGKRFYGCSNYPKCKWASWRKPRPGGGA